MNESLQAMFDLPYVHTNRKDAVVKSLTEMAREGASKFQVVADFDMTLTKYYVNGTKGCTCHGIPENGGVLPPAFTNESHVLRDFYYPLEISPDYTHEQKISYMIEWWSKAHNLLMKYDIRDHMIPKMVGNVPIALREGHQWLLETLSAQQIPLLVFSAGLSNMIVEVLRQKATLHNNIKVVSNDMIFKDGKLTGFSEPLIHSFNKGDVTQHHTAVFHEVKERTNIILLGDSTGDPTMLRGFPYVKNHVKLGFLNYKEQELMDKYLELYDVVVTGDNSLYPANVMLSTILNGAGVPPPTP